MPIKRDNIGSKYTVYDLDWLCSDGDGAQLSFLTDKPEGVTRELQVTCFSGMGASFVVVDEMDFGVFTQQGVVWTEDFEQMALNIANYLCEKLGLEAYTWKQQ